MSLVAYAASSDEESEQEEDDIPVPVGLQELKKATTLSLPKPKNIGTSQFVEEELKDVTPIFAKLPMPKTASISSSAVIEEVDDEFLHKKALPNLTKGPVKITIPSLKEFSDVDKEKANKLKSKMGFPEKPKGSGLLSMLPQAKSEQNFAKTPSATLSKPPAFIPDAVKNRRPAYNTEGVDGLKLIKKKPITTEKPKIPLVKSSDSEGSDDDSHSSVGDFFSLNDKEQLPEVSANEINAMVAKRAAKMTETARKYLDAAASKQTAQKEEEQQLVQDVDMQQAQKRYHEQQLDADAMQALVGSSGKRRRRQQPDIHVVDLSSEQVLPDREEWMRTALASSTTYQPTGVLVDEEPASGTRRKHQITYLAHKAKANEAELQAMWAANRQNRRATQSKYGF